MQCHICGTSFWGRIPLRGGCGQPTIPQPEKFHPGTKPVRAQPKRCVRPKTPCAKRPAAAVRRGETACIHQGNGIE